MNPIYHQMLMQNLPANNVMSLFQRFNEFKSNFSGNPEEMVLKLRQSGQVSQQEYDQAVLQAQQLQRLFHQIPAFGAQDVSINRIGGQSVR